MRGDSRAESALFVSARKTNECGRLARDWRKMTTRRAVAVRSNKPRKPTRINKVAEKLVDEKADEICKGLAEAAGKGHVMSAQLLIDLADGAVEIEEALEKRPLNTIAMRLGAELQLPNHHPDAEEEHDSPRLAHLTV